MSDEMKPLKEEDMKALYGLGTKEGANLHAALRRFMATIKKMTKDDNLTQGVAVEAALRCLALTMVDMFEGMNGQAYADRAIVVQAVQNEIAKFSAGDVIGKYVKDGAKLAIVTPKNERK